MFLLLFTLGITAFAGLWLLNSIFSVGASHHSHIGRAIDLLLTGRFDAIYGIITRKLAMNWHLIGVSSWSKVFITSLIVIVIVVVKPRGIFHRWQQDYPFMMYGFSANAIGSMIVLVLNDSGIVAAATMIIFAAAPMLVLRLLEKNAKFQVNSDSHSS